VFKFKKNTHQNAFFSHMHSIVTAESIPILHIDSLCIHS